MVGSSMVCSTLPAHMSPSSPRPCKRSGPISSIQSTSPSSSYVPQPMRFVRHQDPSIWRRYRDHLPLPPSSSSPPLAEIQSDPPRIKRIPRIPSVPSSSPAIRSGKDALISIKNLDPFLIPLAQLWAPSALEPLSPFHLSSRFTAPADP